MAKIIANDIRVGNILDHKNGLWEILKIIHTQPGKGGAYIQAEMKEITQSTKLNERFRSSEYVIKAILDEEEYQYLYSDNNEITLMNKEDYEQRSIPKILLGEKDIYLCDDVTITLLSYGDKLIKAKVPKHLTYVVKETEATIKGQTATSSFKPAVLDNGVKIMVPPFIKIGDMVIINTEDNSYVERAK